MMYTKRLFSILVLTIITLVGWQDTVTAQCNDCWLEVEGSKIVNAHSGQEIILRAVGLGGWLLQEGYMLNPQGCDGCPGTQWQMKLQYLTEDVPIAEVEDFYQQWRDNFITKADIDFIASLGFNSVRLPMHYELFLTNDQRAVRNQVITDLYEGHDHYKEQLQSWVASGSLFVEADLEGFRKIDQLVQWCSDNGMYVILDMHAAPGSQGSDKNISDGFHDNNLWLQPVFQDVLDQLWLSISDRYKNEPRIAMYELVNEPNNVPGGGIAIQQLTQRLISTIRNNGDNHMIGVSGNGWGNHYDFLEPFNFSPNWGLVYSAHRYWIDPDDDWIPNGNPNVINRMIDLINFRATHNVPIWVGETGENTNDWLEQNIDKLDNAGVGWCHWTYKRHDWQENAALCRIGGNYPTDGAFAMPVVLEQIKFENLIPNINTLEAVTADLPVAGSHNCFPPSENCIPIGETVWLRGHNGKFISSEDGLAEMTCEKSTITESELFSVLDLEDGKVGLQSQNELFVSSENGEVPMNCDRTELNAWEVFDWVDLGNHKFSLRGNNGRFVSSENGLAPINCNRESILAWEEFRFGVIRTVLVDDFETTRGQFRGRIRDLRASDDSDLRLLPIRDSKVNLGVSVEFEGQSPTSNPEFVQLSVESSVHSLVDIRQTIELFDFQDAVWVQVYSDTVSESGDTVVKGSGMGLLSRFVEPSTQRVLGRCKYETINGTAKFEAQVDQAFWAIGVEN